MEAIGTLAGGIAHNFNNLLMGIHGHTALMHLQIGPHHPHIEHLKGIEDCIKSSVKLTKQLLGFARGGKYEIKPTDMNEIIDKSADRFGRIKKDVTIHLKSQPDIWSVEVDQKQIEQVLLNLYINAWQAMPGGGDLYIQTENVVVDENCKRPYQVEPGKYVQISLTDTGVGMDKAIRERIFDPFFTTKRMDRGAGLGLASVYGIIKNHGGFIDVYSEKGIGTTFKIHLPTSEKEPVKEKNVYEKVLKGTETILFVDDEDIIIRVGKDMIESLGYEVLIAENGKEAIEIYKKNMDKIDMVMLDIIMPVMDGGETYDKLKEINPDIKVLLSSGYGINGQATEILDRGCNGFIQKPFNMRALSKKIRDILDK
jgi:CheY-like chemotaxis protein